MFINERKNEIVATKAEYAKAMKVGTPEFEELFRARQLYPTAKVVIKKSKNQDNYPKLTKPFMLGYVEFKDKEYYDEFNKLFDLIGKPNFEDDSGEPKTYSFFDVREVFLNRYPKFMNEKDRKKFEDAKREAEKKVNENQSEENTNVIDMPIAG